MHLNITKAKTRLLFLIVVLIGFQQFPVIRVGGSLKVYEIMAIGILVLTLFSFKDLKFFSVHHLLFFIFFVISPIISLVVSYVFLDYPSGFYQKYPDDVSFKFNYYIFPLLQLIYMFFNYAVISNLVQAGSPIYSDKLFRRVLRAVIYVGTFIALYSVVSMFTVDVVLMLPDFIQNKSEYLFRSYGMSQEPSFYVLYQAWVCLITYYSNRLFDRKIWVLLFLINVVSLILTFSTTLIALFAIVFISTFIFKTQTKYRLMLLGGFVLIVGIAYFFLLNSGFYETFEYMFITKASSFFSAPQHTMDSGSFRSYTTRIGLKIFSDYPLTGVGVGNSIYYMYIYEFQMGIKFFGEKLQAGSFPQNMFSIVLSEQGLIGGICIATLLVLTAKKLWVVRNYDSYTRMFFIGFLFNVAAMLTIAPVYSLFLWVFIALGIGYASKITVN